jgi:hypothetical protein
MPTPLPTSQLYCLSVRQPWADFIVLGVKDVENRSFRIQYRGPLLIHASKTYDDDAGFTNREARTLKRAGIDPMDYESHFGFIIGKVDVIDCVTDHQSEYFEGRYGWVLKNAKRLRQPIPWKGAVGLFKVPAKVMKGKRFR